jgi:D-alanyl-lipoteichoic acid acyltransferase DltB (MBOAT superfamily)
MIVWGLFKKMVIADNCAEIVNTIFAQHETASSLELIVGAVLFAFQIYGDFSGYSDIASGTAKLFGFNLMINFKTPYFSRDIAEFWRRWHISLSSWFRDYVYIPLGGSKGSPVNSFVNVVLVFLLSGLWHGANWTFISWGAINAIYFLPLMVFGTNRKNLEPVTTNGYWPGLKNIAAILTTFLITCLAWIFFRAESIQQAVEYVIRIFSDGTFLIAVVSMRSVVICFIFVGLFVLVEWFFQLEQIPFLTSRKTEWPSRLFYVVTIVSILLFRYFGQELEFIYFQF